MATVMTGMSIMTEATMLTVIIQEGSGPPTRWCMPFQL